MHELKIEEEKQIPDGCSFRRSDGQGFYMVRRGDAGSMSLFAGESPERPPFVLIRDFGVSVSDKLGEARRWILAYPNSVTS